MKLLLGLLLAASAFSADLVRTWQGIPGLERTARGRIFVSWFSGGPKEPSPENTVLLSYSDDNGKTFTPPVAMAQPQGEGRTFDPTLWIDPGGRLWYIFNRGDKVSAKHGVYARICTKPDAKTVHFGAEFRIGFDSAPFSFRMNKPTVLNSGEWILPVTHAAEPVHDWFAGPKQLQGVAISRDRGRSWTLRGALPAPHWALENMIVERKDRSLWMLIRTGAGVLWESTSSDRGQTWSEPKAGSIPNPGSRFFIRRLKSGNLLLVNHYKFFGRSHLTARISIDDGRTWNEGLLLDERAGVSYPDGVEAKDGTIRIVYDRDRQGAGEILMASFQERDVIAGKDVTHRVRLRQLVNRLDWDPVKAANRVMEKLVTVTGPEVKGAHDAEFVTVGDRAYIVAMANDIQPGESPEWDFVYVTLSVVNLKTMEVEKRIPVAKGGQAFSNETLAPGAIFVPRILRKDDRTLRVFLASEQPKKRQSQVYYLDFDIERMAFEPSIHRAKITTAAGTFDMQPQRYYEDAVAQGFPREPKDYGLYLIDGFKQFDGNTYAVLNNFAAGQNGWGRLNEAKDTFTVVGHFNSKGPEKLTEAAVNRLPDGSWLAICRQDGGTGNYMFSTSKDGKTWSPPGYREEWVKNGTNSKPNFEYLYGTYYLGWQEATKVDGVSRSVFNIETSTDGIHWERRYRFATNQSFQYLSLHAYRGSIYLTVTQGDSSPSRKERILFGKLE